MRIALYNLHFRTLGGGERRTAALADYLSHEHEVTLFVHELVDPKLLEKLFSIDLSRVKMIPLAGRDEAAEIAAFAPDLFISNSYGSELSCPAPLGIYMCMFPERHVQPPRGYNVVTANSHFTENWIRQFWQLDADVVYSPCHAMGPPGRKDKIILNVGRCFAPTPGNHHKRQDLLVEIFSEMKDAHDEGWELHFAGNAGPLVADSAFLSQLQAQAASYPIYFHLGLELTELRALYRRAALYWHATGFGFDPSLYPEKQEHFGMSIVEAMSAGAVPLAHKSGGPLETIVHDSSGLLWSDRHELGTCTRQLLKDIELREQMSARAVERSGRYSAANFFARMDAIIRRLTPNRAPLLSS